MKALTREQALRYQEQRRHEWAVEYSQTCDTSRFIGLDSRQIREMLIILGLGFDKKEMPGVVSTIQARMAGVR